jgi:RNA-binding protein Musashi
MLQGYRGIGFVTFASPDSVEKVMAVKHFMNGHEVAIDRATPKEEPSALKSMFARLPLSASQRRSFDNGERSTMHVLHLHQIKSDKCH